MSAPEIGDLEQGVAGLSVRGQTVNILGFAGHAVSVKTTQFCHCR